MRNRLLALAAALLFPICAHAGSILTQGALNTELGTSCASQSKSLPCIAPSNLSDLIVSGAPGSTGTVGATGSNQAGAAALTFQNAVVTPVPNGSGVILPTAVAGQIQRVCNDDLVDQLALYPASGAAIGVLGTNNPGTITPGQCFTFLAVSSTSWRAVASAITPPPVTPGFFVATNGSDSNAGTLGAPFLTLAKCQTVMQGSSTKTCYIRAGTYAMTSGLTLGTQDVGETWSYYPPDGLNSAKLTQNSAFRFFTIQTGADQVTITGLTATGFEAVSGLGSCTGTESMFIDAWISAANNAGPNNLTATNNNMTQFDCGILLLEGFNPVVSFNQFTNIGYAALVGNHITGVATQTVWQGNIFYDLDPNVAPGGPNSYGITFSTTANGQSSNFTVLSNQAYNCHTWTCFNTHGGTNIFWYNNIAVFSGSLSANTANFTSTPAGAPGTITNQIFQGNVADNGANGSTLNATAYVICSYNGCGSSTGVSGGNIQNNTSLFGTANGTQIYASSPPITVSNNTGGLNPETVSSIKFAGGATSATATHGVGNGIVATFQVNMSNTAWAFPFPPGTLSIGGVNSGGFVICKQNQICQPSGGTAAATYSDFSITATLHGMSGSPVLGAASGVLSITLN